MEFVSGVLDAKAPVDATLSFVPLQSQGLDLSAEGCLVGETLPETDAGEDAELDLRHIQPAAMLGRVVKLQPFGDAPGLRRRKGLIQRRHLVGVQIAQDHSDHRDVGICFVHQPAHLMGEVLFGAPFRYRYMPPPQPGVHR